ncbi:hypothetical protein KVR01_007807 [Diaporthe batatas]|uniref:uncharacterized protein n=1 Tax=Diaporthe batatas TaxID=748121 RepID=UPI001D038E4A|nr:uncharacterized protein KVR01_007807 [Diaporthe batatas]KAG8162042.1 hypothetical protein KVR01_007807 [Diaporthe batatas]
MSDQDAINRLDHAVKVAEGTSTHYDYYLRHRKTAAQIAEEGFPLFKNLPPEMRSQIWKEAMPPYGIYTVLMLGREEPRPQQPPAPAPIAFRVVYRLEPVPRDQQDDELRVRLDNMRTIQAVNSEAAHEVQMAFPTTIDCTGGKIRFNAVHDSLNLSDLQCLLGCGFLERFGRYTQGAVVFANDWHKIPHTMLFNNHALWLPAARSLHPDRQLMKGFLDFLADCTNLKALGLTCDIPCAVSPRFLLGSLPDLAFYPLLTPAMRNPFYEKVWRGRSHFSGLGNFLVNTGGIRAFLHEMDPARFPPYPQPATFSPTENHLQFLAVVPVGDEEFF